MSGVVDEEVHGMTEIVDLADIEVVHQRTEYLQHQYGHVRRKQCMVEMAQATDPGLTTYNLKETCGETADIRRGTFVAELALRGGIPVPMNLQGTRGDLAGRKGSIEIGGWSLIRETEVIGEMAEIEGMAVEAEGSAEEVAMRAKGSEALEKTRGHGGDLLNQTRSRGYITSKCHPERRFTFIFHNGAEPGSCFSNVAIEGSGCTISGVAC